MSESGFKRERLFKAIDGYIDSFTNRSGRGRAFSVCAPPKAGLFPNAWQALGWTCIPSWPSRSYLAPPGRLLPRGTFFPVPRSPSAGLVRSLPRAPYDELVQKLLVAHDQSLLKNGLQLPNVAGERMGLEGFKRGRRNPFLHLVLPVVFLEEMAGELETSSARSLEGNSNGESVEPVVEICEIAGFLPDLPGRGWCGDNGAVYFSWLEAPRRMTRGRPDTSKAWPARRGAGPYLVKEKGAPWASSKSPTLPCSRAPVNALSHSQRARLPGGFREARGS